jgi:hypothetical protein
VVASSFFQREIIQPGKLPLLLLLVAFLTTFVAARLYTRTARDRGWGSGQVGNVHVHHIVPGIVLVLLAGLLGFSSYNDEIVVNVSAVAFGCGSALVLDEFALVFHLDDVYWENEGRSSIVGVLLAAVVAGLILVVTAPFGVDGEAFGYTDRLVVFGALVLNSLVALVAFLKGRPFTGIVAIFVPFIGLIAWFRLAHPSSPWAHVFYRGEKLERARARHAHGGSRVSRVRARLVELVGGFPAIPHHRRQPSGDDAGSAPRSGAVAPGGDGRTPAPPSSRDEPAEHDAEQQVPERSLREGTTGS